MATLRFLLVSGFLLSLVDAGVHRERRQVTLDESLHDPCQVPCTRALFPVRGIQGGNTALFPNKCEFMNAQCRSNRARSAPLLLAEDQTNIVWPSTIGNIGSGL
ncbi:uncharacterized protein LOC111713103 isoform X2 [Eurytemora carolleeae]|uniref:uncharacterized protein LOC111713103 isoform X2 n=1 Tax=Eurytemora carolleeae TaxID=1294199 RepID=UPI000C7570C2|nr:uncharacterized protein LOC111713103 isoform X2 [Eurytemora carolleeae]|eukprot:XP_023343668.1 uncharacterized protein LOC111713103 isoform X2 [Eurytemora affinis]